MPNPINPKDSDISGISQPGQVTEDSVSESSLDFDTATQNELDAHISTDIGVVIIEVT